MINKKNRIKDPFRWVHNVCKGMLTLQVRGLIVSDGCSTLKKCFKGFLDLMTNY